MNIIADSGSTKTAWWIGEEEEGKLIYTQGINPFQQNSEDILTIITEGILPYISAASKIEHVWFYGAGCTPEKSLCIDRALRLALGHSPSIFVGSDMLGAARSLCRSTPGIACILGTGSNSCYYDGNNIHLGNPALGFILGDEGSGAYIGKRLVGDILKHQMPDDLCQAFFAETGKTQAGIIECVYRYPLPNRFLASLSPFCHHHRSHPSMRLFLLDCFSQFFIRNILSAPWPCQPTKCPIHCAGSIAHYYEDELRQAAALAGCTIGKIVQSPIEGMIEYHKEQIITKH